MKTCAIRFQERSSQAHFFWGILGADPFFFRMSDLTHLLGNAVAGDAAHLRLGGGESFKFESRAHFFSAAVEAIQRILVESARRHG